TVSPWIRCLFILAISVVTVVGTWLMVLLCDWLRDNNQDWAVVGQLVFLLHVPSSSIALVHSSFVCTRISFLQVWAQSSPASAWLWASSPSSDSCSASAVPTASLFFSAAWTSWVGHPLQFFPLLPYPCKSYHLVHPHVCHICFLSNKQEVSRLVSLCCWPPNP